MNDCKLYRWASFCIIGVTLSLAVYFALDYLFFAILPFAIAWLTAFALRPVSAKISSKTRLSERVVRLILSIFTSGAIISAITVIIWYIVNKSWRFLSNINEDEEFMRFLSSLFDGGFFSKLLYGEELIEYIGAAVRAASARLLEKLGALVSNIAMKLPGVFVFMLVTIIASAYFAYDLDKINGFVGEILPSSALKLLRKIRRSFSSVGIRYVRSYLIIMLLTFATMLVGFSILRIEYAVLIALFVAALDILPVFGVGTVLVPWSVLSFISGEVSKGVGLIVLFLFITVLREIVEPKILGKNLGLHPLLALVLLYVGYSFFGFLGMVLLPPLGALTVALFGGKEEKKKTKSD